MISADEVKIYKPVPTVYQLAVHRLGVEKDRIGFVSSNYFDAAGAKSFGFRTHWINRASAPPEKLGILPDANLRLLTDLIKLV